MKPSEEIKQRIKEWEGCRLDAYVCPAGVLTIGYGHTGKDVHAGQHISQAQADALFASDLAKVERQLNEVVMGMSLTQGQYDALLSFAYNTGIGALKGSTLLRKARVNTSDPTIPNEFMRWVNGGGKVLPGLVKRRKYESELWQQ